MTWSTSLPFNLLIVLHFRNPVLVLRCYDTWLQSDGTHNVIHSIETVLMVLSSSGCNDVYNYVSEMNKERKINFLVHFTERMQALIMKL